MGLKREELWNLRLRDARSDIASLLTSEPTWTRQALEHLLSEQRKDWRFPNTITAEYFCDYLTRTRLLRKVVLPRKNRWDIKTSYPGEIVLYARNTATPFEIALAIRSHSHLSHLSAAFVHGITNLLPKTVFTNREQGPKSTVPRRKLEQEAVDAAFSKPARTTSNVYILDEHEIVLLSGQSTGQIELETQMGPDNQEYPVSSLERTLIECTVRPCYAGGIHEVLSMYQVATSRVGVRRLRSVLEQLHLKYPYRQAVGFLLERAGYPSAHLRLFQQPPFEIDFYLDNAIIDPGYSTTWRLYYPQGV